MVSYFIVYEYSTSVYLKQCWHINNVSIWLILSSFIYSILYIIPNSEFLNKRVVFQTNVIAKLSQLSWAELALVFISQAARPHVRAPVRPN